MRENGFVLPRYGPPEKQRLLTKVVATACSMEEKQLIGILEGKRRIGNVAACKLQQGTGIPASFWLNMERAHRARLAAGKTWVRNQ